ncbi:unnamed protein product [Rotaria sp. Silwood2]|nr:unnamed protein product [Rotaria sp. Silwood2]
MDVYQVLSYRIPKLIQDNPEHSSKPIYVLTTVNYHVNDQLEQRLQQANNDYHGERLVLIPYNLGNSHSTGIFIKFKADDHIERAEFINPVNESNYIPDELQQYFNEIFPGAHLQLRTCEHVGDRNLSAVLTIKNLLAIVEESEFTTYESSSTNNVQTQPIDWQHKDPNIDTSLFSEGNHSKFSDSVQKSKSIIESSNHQHALQLPVKILETKEPFDISTRQSRYNESKIEIETSKEIIQSHITTVDIQNSTNDASLNINDTSSISKSYEDLKKQLQNCFDELDISNEDELKSRIEEKKKRIEDLAKQGKHDNARKREKSLTKLEEVQSLMNRIKELETFELNDDFQTLKKQLDTAFVERDIDNEEHLKELIIKKKKRIEALENERKYDIAHLRKNSLSELENIQLLIDKINSMKSSLTQIESEMSQKFVHDIDSNENVMNSFDQEEFSITNESLCNMYQDFCSLPPCSERSVICLLYYISLHLINNKITLDPSIVLPDNIEIEIDRELEILQDRLKLEESSSSEIRNSIKELSIYIKNKHWKNCISLLRKIFQEISPLNIHDLFRLIEKVDDAAELIKNKDIIFLLGGTGSGKSTTIHFLAGSKMIATTIGGLNHIAATDIKNPDLRNVTTSPFAKSETRCIRPVTINFDDVGAYHNGSIILCDTPGFEDTNGPEVDIANGISIVKAIRRCRSVKPVVLISYKSIGDRFEGLKNLTHLLAGLIPSINDQITAFSYIFTKYPENERHTIHASLENIKKTMTDQEKFDTSFMNLFRDMLQKTKRHTLVLDPIQDEPGDLLDELVNSAVIQYPEEVFQFSITDKSKAIVHEQVRNYQLSIISAVKRSEYSLIKYQLDQLKRLKDLLNQEYIEQIYTDCIQHLSRHLLEEYQEGTSILNRCLMHQTVLTDDDIKQYQVYFDHANFAEKLRNEHLNNEGVHSSAFIQYLNQQLDQIDVDLREKESDDSSVKVSLDKIKLLKKYFPDISNTYERICQSFAEKIEFKVNSFENSVLNNQFTESAAIMKSLSDTLNILHDHLDHQNIETKYLRLKEYFINYLNNSAKELDHIFKQTKLEKTDIDKINNCLSMLETALKTLNLEVHISNQYINQIYQNFSSKILKYFENIIQEIKTEFKKQNAFQNLENLIQQLDLIRTISSIALETSQVYYATLEELFGYIYQSRRDAEELLRLLFQGGETVGYEKLIKCLSNLKNATWIEKYRPGLYSDVINDVEQQITQHVEKLKKSIIKINLDLDHSHNIKHVSKILSDINEMKYLENFISTVNEHIEEANSWFQTTTNNVFDIIKNTFSLEKWKEQEYKTLDFIKAEKAFYYLDSCKDGPVLIKRDCISVLNNLEGFIRDFSDLVQKEMETCFETIKKSQNTNTNDILDKVRILSSRLQEISDIEKACPRVFSHFSKKTIVKDWQTELSSYCFELSGEMARLSVTQRAEALNIRLLTAKAFSKLDKFLEGEKYIDIYNKYQNIFFTQSNDIGQQIIDAIKNFDYESVAVRMMTLQSSNEVGKHFYAEAKRPLNAGLNQLMEGTEDQVIMLGNNIAIEDIRLIVENLKRMERAKQFIEKHLDAPNKIDDCIRNVKAIIEERIKRYLAGVKALIDNHNFYEADRKIESITLVRNLLGKYCTKEISDQIENLNEYQNTVVLTNVVDKYSEMDISGYTLNPPTDIFERFGQVNQTNPVYNQALNQIKEKILVKFREELDKAKSKQPPDSENIHIRKFESAVKYLPDAMRNALEVELRHCKEDIVQLIQDNENKLNNAFSSGDVRNIKSILLEYEKSQELQSFANRVKALVLKQIQEIVLKINENFEHYEIREAFTHVKKLYIYKIELEEVMIDINRPYSEVRLRIIKIFEDAYLFFTNRFLNSHMSMSENEGVLAIEKSFICLTEFIKFQDDHKNQQILIYILPDDFSDKINTLITKIQDYSNEHETKYKHALEKIDTDSLLNILKIMLIWSSLLTKIKVYYDMYNNRDTSMEIMMTSLQQLTHHSQILQSISRRIEDLKNELLNQELLNHDTREFSTTRDEFYRKLNEKLIILSRTKAFSQFNIQIDIDRIEKDCLESLESKIRTLCSNSEKILSKISQDNILTRVEYDNINLYYSLKKLKELFFDKIHTWEALIESDPRLQNVVTNLKNIKRIANNISSFRIKVNERIDEVLKNYKSKQDAKALAKLGTVLNQDKDGLGQSIISEHRLFQGFSLSLFNEKTRRHGIEYVLDNLKGDHVDKVKLRRRYDEFHNIYEKVVKENLSPDMKLDKLISDTKLITGNMRENSETITWNAHVRGQIPKLAAHIFAIWTLSKAEHYFEAEGLYDRNNYLIQPHAAQIISIFRLLGIGDDNEELMNNLVQIETGEGKSITLGVTAVILALIGFDVHCACFSKYLSQRDYLAFLPLFDSLEVLHYIHYGTFNKLCEDMINENGDIRHIVEKLISNTTNDDKKISRKNKRPKILLIDEVDVFFSREFYGNLYTPSASLKDPTITSLVNFIWTHRKSNLNLKKIQITPEYQACNQKFPYWILLIDEAIKDMLADVHSFESHDYVVKNDKIGYIEQDNIVYNVVFGYKTLFAYHCEHEKGNISKESLDENISIRINCGSFSYAEVPLQFKYIMGVTGTLETLSDPERKVIKNDYKIIKNTYVPSVFGQNNLRFIEKDDIIIENINDYFNRIKREIDDRIIGRNSEKRAILVVFESKAKLMQFYESPALESIKESVVYLTEDTLLQEKENIINRATVSGQITLFTRTFGRGTDFICHDQIVATNGGTHVIQTFLSEEFSEEKQIKGRTARQGDQGSYSMILLDRDLEKFHIEKSHIDDILKGKGFIARIADTVTDTLKLTKTYDTLYPFLHDKRTELFKTQYEANIKYVEQAKEKHLISQEFLFHLHSGDIDSVRKFLIEENRGAASTSQSRTVCLMDATGSMFHLLHKCKNTVDIMFERASEILKDHSMNPDSFQIQFVVYRNYNSFQNKLLQSSPWETKPHNLRAFMNTIDVEGGWNNEAIEIGLWHANKEHEREHITQVILIGDAPPNTQEDVQMKRNVFGQKYWKKTKFSEATYYEKELEKLVENSIPVHAFYVEMRAEEKFQLIANRTHGRCEMLDINSSLGSDMLTDLVTEEILNNIGGQHKGKDLVTAYRKKFPKSYTSASAESIITTDNNSLSRNLYNSPIAKAAGALFRMSKK